MPMEAQSATVDNTVQGDELRQLVVFRLGVEGFGVNINKVREINRLVEITRIPESPEFIEGVINLRGEIIPIIDMRKRFGMTIEQDTNQSNRIMVIETENQLIGFIVDEVQEVLRIPAGKIDPPPELISTEVDRRYIEGVAALEERLLIVLDSDRIFAANELKSLQKIETEVEAEV